MSIAKRTLLGGFALFLVHYSWPLFADIHGASAPLSLERGLPWGFVLSASVTGIFAFAGLAFPRSRLLPESYYEVEREERPLALYDAMKAGWMRRLLLVAFWGWELNRKVLFSDTRDGLEEFDHETRQSEFGHLMAILVLTVAGFALLLRLRIDRIRRRRSAARRHRHFDPQGG